LERHFTNSTFHQNKDEQISVAEVVAEPGNGNRDDQGDGSLYRAQEKLLSYTHLKATVT
jgi:hypothetical protein